jgi:mRNA deadenylase 3'-5' endonuclease subunit Ccr4
LVPQEVDRLEKLIPVLEEANYGHVYAAGPRKKHGCLIGFRKDSLVIRDQFVLHYDDIDTRADGTERSRKGSSFRTKNIANVVALERLGQPSEGYIVATTHLFWHPSSVRLTERAQNDANLQLAFNFHPDMRMNELGSALYSICSTAIRSHSQTGGHLTSRSRQVP